MMLTLLAEPSLAVETQSLQTPRYGGTLRIPSYGTPAPLDPFNVTDTISSSLFDLIFSKLVRWNMKDGFQDNFEGDLAESWMVSQDGLTYTFYLRKGVKFHDGTPCTAEDVAYSFKLFSDPVVSPTYYRYFEKVEKWEILSDSVFRVKLKEPFSPFLFVIFKIRILPKHKLLNINRNLKSFIANPIGTGAFRFSRTTGGPEYRVAPATKIWPNRLAPD